MNLRRASLLSATAILISTCAFAAETEGNLGIDLGLGYDSNPLAVSADAGGGAYTELNLDAGFRLRFHDRASLFSSVDGRARAHEGSMADADEQRLALRAGLALVPYCDADGKLSLALGGSFDLRRSTFTDPVTGEPYRLLDSAPGGPVTGEAIPERFDSDGAGAFLDVRWKINRRVRLALEAELQRSDFVREYDPDTELHSLDNRTHSIRPSVLVKLADSIWLELNGSRTLREYDRQPARDIDGEEVPGALRQFHYTGYGAALRMAPGLHWRAGVGLISSSREDRYAGYYDSGAWTSYAWASRRIGDTDRLQLFGSWREMDYHNAVIASDPDGDLRGSETVRFIGRYEKRVTGRGVVYVEAGTERSDDRDPVYTYDQGWTSIGYRFRVARGGTR